MVLRKMDELKRQERQFYINMCPRKDMNKTKFKKYPEKTHMDGYHSKRTSC